MSNSHCRLETVAVSSVKKGGLPWAQRETAVKISNRREETAPIRITTSNLSESSTIAAYSIARPNWLLLLLRRWGLRLLLGSGLTGLTSTGYLGGHGLKSARVVGRRSLGHRRLAGRWHRTRRTRHRHRGRSVDLG